MSFTEFNVEELAQEFIEKSAAKEGVGSKVLGAIKRYGQLMAGGKKMNFATGRKGAPNQIEAVHMNVRPGNMRAGYRLGSSGNAEARKEALKSLAARAATAVGVGGAGAGAYAHKKRKEKRSSLDIEMLAQEYFEKIALSPELKGAAGQMRASREAAKAGFNVDKVPSSLSEFAGRLQQGRAYSQTPKGQLHGRAMTSAAQSGNLGRYAQGMASASSAPKPLRQMSIGLGHAVDSIRGMRKIR